MRARLVLLREAVAARLKRLIWLRRLRALLFDRPRFRQFEVTRWMRRGAGLAAREGLFSIRIDAGRPRVGLPNGLFFAYLTEVAGEGLDARVYRAEYETALTELVRSRVGEDGVFLDVGANVGWFTLHAALGNPRVRVHAFEPGRLAFDYLTENVSYNGLTAQVTTNAVALSDSTGTARFTGNDVGHALNHLLPVGKSGGRQVATLTIDDYVAQHGLDRVDLIKIDVEGAEPLVLRGAERTLRQHGPALVLEVNPVWLSRFGFAPENLWAYLREHGYRYAVIDDTGRTTSTGSFGKDLAHGEQVLFHKPSESEG